MREGRREENTILYYPTIKIEDGIWLRNAILYWDKVSSIVPGFNYDETNSIEVEYLRDAGLYEPIYPIEMQSNEELCREFCKTIKKNLKHHNNISNRNRYSKVHIDKMSMSSENKVHIEKTPDDILDYLLDEGIAKRNCDGPWIDMSERDANIYMATLARYLAKTHGHVEIGTDKYREFLYPYLPAKNKREMDKQVYLNVVLQEILPIPNLNIPLEDLIDFKNQYRQQLSFFKHRMDEFQWSLRVCGGIEELQDRIYSFQCEIERDLQEIEEIMSSSGIRMLKKTLKVLVPLGMEAGISILGLTGRISPMQSVVANTAVGLGAQIFCTEKEDQVDEDKAYLFYARRNGIIMPSRNDF